MPSVSDTIPEGLQNDVDAALAWYNAQETETFSVTGIVDADLAPAASGANDLKLVLCGGDMCRQESFRVNGSEVTLLDPILAPAAEASDELDPPPGAMRQWLDSVLGKHDFTLILFYRGFW